MFFSYIEISTIPNDKSRRSRFTRCNENYFNNEPTIVSDKDVFVFRITKKESIIVTSI